jgi:hypothetical protein
VIKACTRPRANGAHEEFDVGDRLKRRGLVKHHSFAEYRRGIIVDEQSVAAFQEGSECTRVVTNQLGGQDIAARV